MIIIQTNMGDIELELFEDKAPITTKNFISYVNAGFYDGTIFHRVIDNFMIQGGGFDENMNQKPTNAPIKNEADNNISNDAYTIAMARTTDPDSASSQFFINVKDNDFLNHRAKTMDGWGYCVFGKVYKGEDVVDKIKEVSTTSKFGHDDVPVNNVVIIKASIS